MSVRLDPVKKTRKNPATDKRERNDGVHISNGEWAAIVAAGRAFGIAIPPFDSQDPHTYPPEQLRELADRIEQLKNAPEWLRYLADCGGAKIS